MADVLEPPDDSSLHDLIDFIEQGPEGVDKILGHIGERDEGTGEWSRFDFEIISHDGERHTIHVDQSDLGDYDWQQWFDFLDDYCDEYDIDYDNKYGETS